MVQFIFPLETKRTNSNRKDFLYLNCVVGVNSLSLSNSDNRIAINNLLCVYAGCESLRFLEIKLSEFKRVSKSTFSWKKRDELLFSGKFCLLLWGFFICNLLRTTFLAWFMIVAAFTCVIKVKRSWFIFHRIMQMKIVTKCYK